MFKKSASKVGQGELEEKQHSTTKRKTQNTMRNYNEGIKKGLP